MSLTLTFRSAVAHTVGPLGSFRIDGEAMRSPDGQLIAKHERNVWQLGENHYPRVECQGRFSIWFERTTKPEVSRKFGPHDTLAIYDGVAYLGERVFASLNPETGTWYSHHDGNNWREIVVESIAQ